MPRRDDPGTKPETKLARARMAARLSQAQLVAATGISRSVYWRLERGRTANPLLRHLTNCALVLGVPVEELIEDEWRTTWLQLTPDSPDRPRTPREIREYIDPRRRAAWAAERADRKKRRSSD